MNDHAASVRQFLDAETAFSKRAGEVGFRDSFLEFFALDGIGFNPEAHIPAVDLAKMEPEPRPLAYKMFWEPKVADCSGAGDLGFTTGPLLITDLSPEKRPPGHMVYFSIWKRMTDGSLKVVFDLGTPMRDAVVFPEFKAPSKPVVPATDDKGEVIKGVAAQVGQVSADLYSSNFVAYRLGSPPILDSAKLKEWQKSAELSNTTVAVKSTLYSKERDFAWTWGSYTGMQATQPVRGYWVQVWKHEPAGWRIVADVMSKLPPKA